MAVKYMKVNLETLSLQLEYAKSDYQPKPKKNRKYSYFDDGKITPSRHSFMKILDVIPFEKARWEMLEFWNKVKEKTPWIFKDETDYFIIGYEVPDKYDDDPYPTLYTTLFARDSSGGWYGFRTDDPETWWTGKLITNPYFNFDEYIQESNRG